VASSFRNPGAITFFGVASNAEILPWIISAVDDNRDSPIFSSCVPSHHKIEKKGIRFAELDDIKEPPFNKNDRFLPE
jgi:hypothetical protein